jgi:tripartite motif-containing protein 71
VPVFWGSVLKKGLGHNSAGVFIMKTAGGGVLLSLFIIFFSFFSAVDGETLQGYRIYFTGKNSFSIGRIGWQSCSTSPKSLAVDSSGDLYVADSRRNSLFVYNRKGDCVKKLEGLNSPVSVAVDKRGRIYIGNAGKGNVEVHDRHSGLLYKLGVGDGEFTSPTSIALDNTGNIYVSDSLARNVKIYNSHGSYSASLRSQSGFLFPSSIAINRKSGELIIADFASMQNMQEYIGKPRIVIFDSKGGFERSFEIKALPTEPASVAIDSSGKIYVTDCRQNVIRIFDKAGNSLGVMYDLDNSLRITVGMAIDENDTSYIGSLNMGRIEVLTLSTKEGRTTARPGKNEEGRKRT